MARLTIQEAAKLTGVSARTIRRRVKDGSLHAEKVLRDGRGLADSLTGEVLRGKGY